MIEHEDSVADKELLVDVSVFLILTEYSSSKKKNIYIVL